MPDSLEVKLRTQAAANTTLANLLGPGDVQYFRWWDSQLRQGSLFPAVVVLTMPGAGMYVSTGRLPTSWGRVQFTIWDTDSERLRDVAVALKDFLDTFDALNKPDAVAYPNYVIGDRAGFYPNPEPPKYLRIIDAMVYSNDEV